MPVSIRPCVVSTPLICPSRTSIPVAAQLRYDRARAGHVVLHDRLRRRVTIAPQ